MLWTADKTTGNVCRLLVTVSQALTLWHTPLCSLRLRNVICTDSNYFHSHFRRQYELLMISQLASKHQSNRWTSEKCNDLIAFLCQMNNRLQMDCTHRYTFFWGKHLGLDLVWGKTMTERGSRNSEELQSRGMQQVEWKLLGVLFPHILPTGRCFHLLSSCLTIRAIPIFKYLPLVNLCSG